MECVLYGTLKEAQVQLADVVIQRWFWEKVFWKYAANL